MSELGELLKKLRGKESLRDAARRIGVSHTYLSILEKGYDLRSKNPVNPTPETLRLISKAYKYEYEELLKVAGIIDEDRDVQKTATEAILKELAEEFNIDLTDPEQRKTVQDAFRLIFGRNQPK